MTPSLAVLATAAGPPALIDPFAPTPEGIWHGSGVTVRRIADVRLSSGRLRAHRESGRLIVDHGLRAEDLSDDLASTIVTELAGLLGGQSDFEEVFTGVIRSTVDGPAASWLTFYRNSLTRLEAGVADFSPVHRYATELVCGTDVLDLGSCFGFFPLSLHARGIDVLATDLSASTMGLLADMGVRLGRPVRTLACAAQQVPLPDGYAATVTALHLIEHLRPHAAAAVIDEALRLARRRVVVAVPFEAEPMDCYGHVQRFGPADLDTMANRLRDQHPDITVTVAEHHGGWLIADRR